MAGKRHLTVAAIIAGASLFIGLAAESADPPALGENPEYMNKPVGLNTCGGCHQDQHLPDVKAEIKRFIRYDETLIWNASDIHKNAFVALTGDPGQAMSLIMFGDKNAAATKPECLTCHALDLAPNRKLKDKVDYKKYFYIKPEHGNSCEVCHGYAPLWNAVHSNTESPANLRDMTHGADKLIPPEIDAAKIPAKLMGQLRLNAPLKKKLGMNDLRDPEVRSERCTSCHVGNVAEGKFVTHEMYAAGHPPLMPFETVSYSRDQPAHFQPAKTLAFIKEYAKADPDQCWKILHYRTDELQGVRHLVYGAITSVLAQARMLEGEAKEIAEASGQQRAIDFAHFDCYACHHDLKAASWRQERGYHGRPGRPQLRPAALPLLQIIVQHAQQHGLKPRETDVGAKVAALTEVFNRVQFGDSKEVQKAAGELARALAEFRSDLAGIKYTAEHSRELLQAILRHIDENPRKKNPDSRQFWLDPDSAQHLTWAIEAIRAELEEGPNGPIEAALKANSTALPDRFVRPTNERQMMSVLVPKRLERIASFDLSPFQTAMRQIQKAIPK